MQRENDTKVIATIESCEANEDQITLKMLDEDGVPVQLDLSHEDSMRLRKVLETVERGES